MGSTGAQIAASSVAMLARLISETYLSVVAFGFRSASAIPEARLRNQPAIVAGLV
jgi:hypothetical protein